MFAVYIAVFFSGVGLHLQATAIKGPRKKSVGSTTDLYKATQLTYASDHPDVIRVDNIASMRMKFSFRRYELNIAVSSPRENWWVRTPPHLRMFRVSDLSVTPLDFLRKTVGTRFHIIIIGLRVSVAWLLCCSMYAYFTDHKQNLKKNVRIPPIFFDWRRHFLLSSFFGMTNKTFEWYTNWFIKNSNQA